MVVYIVEVKATCCKVEVVASENLHETAESHRCGTHRHEGNTTPESPNSSPSSLRQPRQNPKKEKGPKSPPSCETKQDQSDLGKKRFRERK
ncbi:uncharacterized protein HKW66_Vig0051270 [Vigna angularis]|uniref:Uncharacterized protein n=1 Tax=Phaseolus angularis TaxID=3914 RepID=A0A8T0L2X0_PHAAN|nr:uncharacterized protein HKW66_Vig0051270 [Vigna angularis]